MAATSGAVRAGRAFVEIMGDDSQLQRTLKTVQTRLQNFGGMLQGIGSRMFAGSAVLLAPLAALGAGGLKLAADFESTSAAIESMLGSAEGAKKLLAELTTFAADTPFEFPELADASKKLLAFGVDAGRIVPTLAMLGDIAAGLDIPLGELAEIFGKAKVQGRLFMEDINQLTGRGIPIIQELAKQFGVSESEVRGLVEAGKIGFPNLEKAIQSLTGEGGKFFGLTAKQSKLLKGLWSTLSDSISLVSRAIGDALLPIAKSATASMITLIGGISGWMTKNQELVQKLALGLLAVGGGLAGLMTLGGGLLLIGSAISGLAGIAGFAFSGILAGVTALLSPIGMAAVAFAGLTAGAGYLFAQSETGAQAIAGLREQFGALGAEAGIVFDAIKNALAGGDFEAAANVLWSSLNLAWTKGTGELASIWTMFTTAMSSAWIDITHGIANAFDTAVNAIAKAFEYISAFFEGGFDYAAVKGGEASAALDASLQEKRTEREQSRTQAKMGLGMEAAGELAKAQADLAAARSAYQKSIADAQQIAPKTAAPEATAVLDTAQATIATAQTASVGTFSSSARAGGPDSGVVGALGQTNELLRSIDDKLTEEAG